MTGGKFALSKTFTKSLKQTCVWRKRTDNTHLENVYIWVFFRPHYQFLGLFLTREKEERVRAWRLNRGGGSMTFSFQVDLKLNQKGILQFQCVCMCFSVHMKTGFWLRQFPSVKASYGFNIHASLLLIWVLQNKPLSHGLYPIHPILLPSLTTAHLRKTMASEKNPENKTKMKNNT